MGAEHLHWPTQKRVGKVEYLIRIIKLKNLSAYQLRYSSYDFPDSNFVYLLWIVDLSLQDGYSLMICHGNRT